MRRSLMLATSLTAVMVLAVPAATGRATKTVDVGDDFFDPKRVKIKEGDKIAWNWTGTNDHNVTKVKGPGKFFESKTTSAPGVNFTKRFNKDGTYKIICTLHEDMRMKAIVE
jgi:plastocyanin